MAPRHRDFEKIGHFGFEQLIAGISHAAQIDLRFGDPPRELFGCRLGVWAGDLARKGFHLL
jgi:hypothetical protein